jgi:hypothetical protein
MPKDVPKPQHTSATAVIAAVTAASNAHPPLCSATVIDASDDANNCKFSLKHARTLSIASSS